MKTIYKSLLSLSAALVAFVSCQQEKNPYTPAEKENGTQYYFSVDAPSSFAVPNGEVTSVKIPVLRTSAEGAAEVAVSVSDTSGIFYPAKSATVNVSFDSGSKESAIEVPVDFDILSQDFGHEYGLIFTIMGNTTQYALSSTSAVIYAPEPWTSLGYGVWEDAWLFEDTFEKVEFFQNDLYPNQFRIGWSAAICENYEDENPEDWPEFFDFTIVPSGSDIAGVTVDQDGIIYYDIFNTGYYVSNYSDYISIVHCSAFSNRRTMELYSKNKVTAYQDNGLPATVELAPAYYLLDYGAGWASQCANVNMKLTFPGVVIRDYTIGLTYEGILTDPDNACHAQASVELIGADIQRVDIVMVPGDDPSEAITVIEEGDESVVSIKESGQVHLSFSEDDAPGKYTIVAVPVGTDKEGNEEFEWDDALFETFNYGYIDPMEREYTSDDFTAVIDKDYLLETTWIAFAAGWDGSPAEREACAYVNFADAEDNEAGDDLITVSGLAYTSAFDDAFTMEYYRGFIYTLNSDVTSTYGAYDVIPLAYGRQYYGGNYAMIGAYVDDEETIIALVNNSSSDYFYGFAWWAVDDDDIAGYLIAREYLLLVDSSAFEAPSSQVISGSTVRKIEKSLSGKQDFPRNYVEITPSAHDWSKDVIASGKVLGYSRNQEPVQESIVR